jgi:hypothetical protein
VPHPSLASDLHLLGLAPAAPFSGSCADSRAVLRGVLPAGIDRAALRRARAAQARRLHPDLAADAAARARAGRRLAAVNAAHDRLAALPSFAVPAPRSLRTGGPSGPPAAPRRGGTAGGPRCGPPGRPASRGRSLAALVHSRGLTPRYTRFAA